MKLSPLIALTMALAACGKSDHANKATPIQGPTTVGNGGDLGPTRLYQNSNFGIGIEYPKDLKMKETASDFSSVELSSPDSKVHALVKFKKNPVMDAQRWLLSQSKNQDPLLHLQGFEAAVTLPTKENSKITALVASAQSLVEIEADNKASLDTVLAGLKLLESPCSKFAKGDFAIYEQSRKVNSSMESAEITYSVEEIKDGNVIINVHPLSAGGLQRFSCADLTTRDLIQEQKSGSERAFRRPSEVKVEFGKKLSQDGQILDATLVKESFLVVPAPMTRTYIVETTVSAAIPMMGVYKRSLIEQRGTEESIVESWKFIRAGHKQPNSSLVGGMFLQPIVSKEKIEQWQAMNVDNVSMRLLNATEMLNVSLPRLAFRTYEDLIQEDKLKPGTLSREQNAEAHFGRAFCRMLLFVERAEYQELQQKMGYLPYFPSDKIFGPTGLLHEVSAMPDSVWNGETEDSKDEKWRLIKRNLPFREDKGISARKVLNRGKLELADYRSIVSVLIEDLNLMMADYSEASSAVRMRFLVPGGFHFGYRTYSFFAPEAKLIEASLGFIVAGLQYSQAYDDIPGSLDTWFPHLNLSNQIFGDWGVDDKKAYYEAWLKEIKAKGLTEEQVAKEMNEFVEIFNKHYMRLRDGSWIEKSRLSARQALDNSATALKLMTLFPSNYALTKDGAEILKITADYVDDFSRSMDIGEVSLRRHSKNGVINLKALFDHPFNSEEVKSVFLTIINDEGVLTYAKNHEFRMDLSQRVIPDHKDFESNPEEKTKSFFYPKAYKDFGHVQGRSFGSIEFCGRVLYQPAAHSPQDKKDEE